MYVVMTLTADEYVLIGGQLFAPQTKAKWTLGSTSFSATFNLYVCMYIHHVHNTHTHL